MSERIVICVVITDSGDLIEKTPSITGRVNLSLQKNLQNTDSILCSTSLTTVFEGDRYLDH